MIYYIYDETHKVYYTQVRVQNESEAPANSTLLKPPVAEGNQVVLFNGTSWEIAEHPAIVAAKTITDAVTAELEQNKANEELQLLLSQTNEFGVNLYELKDGKATKITTEQLKILTNTAALEQLKAKRNDLIKATDFVFNPDAPQIIKDKLELIKTYRQALRDLPANTPDPTNVVWPVNPLD